MEQQENLLKLIKDIGEDVGLEKIRKFGIKYGFQNIYFRQIIWKKLLSFDSEITFDIQGKSKWHDQLLKDVNRSLNTIVQVKNVKHVELIREDLMQVLNSIFSAKQEYSYYQGYHDIASVFILVLGVEQGFQASLKAAHYFFRDYLEQELQHSLTPQLLLIHQIMLEYARDFEDQNLFRITDVIEQPTCVIPWILTWFSHSLEDINDICRVWDFLLCQNQCAIIYLCAAVIIQYNQFIDTSYQDDIMGNFQEFFQNINAFEFRVDQVLKLALQLQKKYQFLQLCLSKNIKFQKNSLIYDKNFLHSIPYYKEILKRRKSILFQLHRFYFEHQYEIISTGGVVASALIQMLKK